MNKPTSHKNVYLIGGLAAAVMFGFCFAMVPLYGLICKKTGINTTVGTDLITAATAESISKGTDLSRNITVQFTATKNMGMPWDFIPRQKSVVVHPGVKTQIYFYAKNNTAREMTAQAIPGMTPTEAIEHFHKIECFCFNQQTLKSGESKEMGMVFQIDKDLPKDVHVITLAYTLYEAQPKADKGK